VVFGMENDVPRSRTRRRNRTVDMQKEQPSKRYFIFMYLVFPPLFLLDVTTKMDTR
jgi:hypothetical protein